MNRVRKTLVLVACLLPLLGGVARADVIEPSPGYYVAGIKTQNFQFVAAQGSQHKSNWCWAACIQMVLQYHGLQVTQEQIVQKVYGGLVDKTAGPQEVLYALNGWAPDTQGRPAQVSATSYGVSPSTLLEDLTAGRPLIVGLQGYPGNHAFVLTAMAYTRDQTGNFVPQGVVLRDPWPGNQSRQEWPWQMFASRVYFVARVQVKRAAAPRAGGY